MVLHYGKSYRSCCQARGDLEHVAGSRRKSNVSPTVLKLGPLSEQGTEFTLRSHGWGCAPDPEGAVRHLTAAASNAASVEQLALQAGLKKGGAAKGELVLAIFELANCFRHGWGIGKDPLAAKQVSAWPSVGVVMTGTDGDAVL